MRDLPVVSVIIPCFNYGKYIFEAVESILNQTMTGIEIIVVEGGSDDGETPQVVQQLDQDKVKVLFRKERHYVGDNRNFGILHAKGKYICCLDADDTLDPTYLEKAIFLMECQKYDLVSTGLRFVGKKDGEMTCGIKKYPLLKCMTEANHVYTCAVFRRDMWEKVGGYFDYGIGCEHIAEDWDLWIRFSAIGARIRNISDEYLLNYRVHPTPSLSNSIGIKSIADQLTVILQRNKELLTPEAFVYSEDRNGEKYSVDLESIDLLKYKMIDSKSKSRTLLIVTPFLLVGGVERLLCELTAYLVKVNWRVIVVSTNQQSLDYGNAVDWIKNNTNEVFSLPLFLEEDEYKPFLHYLISSRNPDYILNTGSDLLYQLLPEISQMTSKAVLIDLLFNTVAHVGAHKFYKQYFDMVIAESNEVYDWFVNEVQWDVARVKKITSGINLEEYHPRYRSNELINKLNITANELVIGFSGRLSGEKAPDIFIELAKICGVNSKIRFVMTGSGPLQNDILEKISNLASNIKFNFLGQVDNISEVIATYDILVLPSRFDGRPFILMEALASGVPVIASSVGSVPEIIQDGMNGYLCEPGNIEQFANKILELTQDINQLTVMKKNARIFAEKHLDSALAFSNYHDALLSMTK